MLPYHSEELPLLLLQEATSGEYDVHLPSESDSMPRGSSWRYPSAGGQSYLVPTRTMTREFGATFT